MGDNGQATDVGGLNTERRAKGGNRWADDPKPRAVGWVATGAGQKAKVESQGTGGSPEPGSSTQSSEGDYTVGFEGRDGPPTYEGPATRALGLARLMMLAFGGLLTFVGLILLGLVSKDTGYAQSSLEINTKGDVEALNKELKFVKSTAEKEKIRMQIAAVEEQGREVDPAVISALGKRWIEATTYVLAGLVLAVCFFTAKNYPRGSTLAALLASLSLIPVIVALMMHTDTLTRGVIRSGDYEVRVMKVYHSGMAMALPLIGAIYVLYKGMLAGRTVQAAREVGR